MFVRMIQRGGGQMIQTEQFYISSQLLIGHQKHRGRVVFYQVATDHRESACMCVKGKDG